MSNSKVSGGLVVSENTGNFLGGAQGDLDIVALEVFDHRPGVIAQLLPRCVVLPPRGEWFERTLKLFASHGEEPLVRVQGFPATGTEGAIDYDRLHVVTQGVQLIGRHTGVGPYPHTRSIRIVDGTPAWDLDGMSGSRVHMRVSDDPFFARRSSLKWRLPCFAFCHCGILDHGYPEVLMAGVLIFHRLFITFTSLLYQWWPSS